MINQKYYKAIFVGAWLLTINAGLINTISLLGIYHNAVSYMTGNLATIGLGLETNSLRTTLAPLSILLAFILGAVIVGMIIDSSQFSVNPKYARALLLLAFVLALSALLMTHPSHVNLSLSECLAAMGCGMQNAITTLFSGALIRTTHMTGVVTDLGIQIGRFLKGKRNDLWKILLFSSLTISFVAGSVLGLILFRLVHTQALWLSVVLCLVSSGSYYFWRRAQNH